MDVFLPPPARRIKHPGYLIEQRIDRRAGNPSLTLSPARVRELLQRRLKQRWWRRWRIKTPLGTSAPSAGSDTRGEESGGYGETPNAPSPTLADRVSERNPEAKFVPHPLTAPTLMCSQSLLY